MEKGTMGRIEVVFGTYALGQRSNCCGLLSQSLLAVAVSSRWERWQLHESLVENYPQLKIATFHCYTPFPRAACT